jgi:Protein of unknown function (DUF4038)/Putative collagen-binding domain of a collagenase
MAVAVAILCLGISGCSTAQTATCQTSVAQSSLECAGESAGATMAEPGNSETGGVASSDGPTRCSPGGPTVDPSSGSSAFPLSVDAPHRQLVDGAGRPFLIVGDAAWSLIAQLSEADAATYLRSRKASGFNTILVSLIEHHFADQAPADVRGVPPFTIPGDFTRPHAEYFDHAERVVSMARDLGFLVLLAPAYAGFDGGDEGWYREMEAMGPQGLRDYGRFVGRRFRSYDNVLWVEGGDYDVPDPSLVNAIAEGIADVSPDSLQTYHSSRDDRIASRWRDELWFTVDNIYTGGAPLEAASQAYRDGTDPFFLIEAEYENERGTAPADLRRQSYETVLAGGIGHVFGNNPIWHFDSEGLYAAPTDWKGQLSSEGTRGMTQFARILGGTDWWKLWPDSGALLSRADSAEAGSAVEALACDGSFAVVYNTAGVPLMVDPSALAKPVTRGVWRDPVDGTAIAADLSHKVDKGFRITPPGLNAGGDPDWVLLIFTQ